MLIFSEIHEIVFHGKGGYTWNDIYSMPIWLRRFTFKKIQEYYKEKQNPPQQTQNQPKEIARPNITPAYSTKASK